MADAKKTGVIPLAGDLIWYAATDGGDVARALFWDPPSSGILHEITVSIEGDGDFIPFFFKRKVWIFSIFFAEGDLSSSLLVRRHIVSTIDGEGDIIPVGLSRSMEFTSEVEGVGNVEGEIRRRVYFLSTLEGIGELLADLTAAALTFAVTIEGVGGIEVDLKRALTFISTISNKYTPEDFGKAMLEASIETGFSLEQIIRLLVAVSAGRSSIVPGAPGEATVAFRDVADTKDRVSADMIGGERSAIIRDAN